MSYRDLQQVPLSIKGFHCSAIISVGKSIVFLFPILDNTIAAQYCDKGPR